MEFSELVRQRRSVRAYEATPLDTQQLDYILAAANRAPSAGNLQAFEIYIVRDRESRKNLAQAAFGQDFVAQAPLSLVFCTHPDRSSWRYRQRGERLYAVQDATIACTFAMLAAADLGLGTVWVGAFNDEAVSQVINAPPEHHPVAILPVGTPADQPALSGRRPLDEFVHEV